MLAAVFNPRLPLFGMVGTHVPVDPESRGGEHQQGADEEDATETVPTTSHRGQRTFRVYGRHDGLLYGFVAHRRDACKSFLLRRSLVVVSIFVNDFRLKMTYLRNINAYF